MGLLKTGQPMSWEETKPLVDVIKKQGRGSIPDSHSRKFLLYLR